MLFPLKYLIKPFTLALGLRYIYPEENDNPNGKTPDTKPKPTSTAQVTTTTYTPTTATGTVKKNETTLKLPVTTKATGPEKDITLPSPSESDPRTGWIYLLSKTVLQEEMRKRGLQAEGKSAELRKRFSEFIRSNQQKPPGTVATVTENVATHTQPTHSEIDHLSMQGAQALTTSTYSIPDPRMSEKIVDGGASELEAHNIREILGLSPNADFNEVRRSLVSASRNGPIRHTIPAQHFMASDRGTETLAPNTLRHHTNVKYGTSVAEICSTVRKWNLKFDGDKNAVSFMERLYELMDAYGTPPDQVLKALPELLKDHALLWYRNYKECWDDFQDFVKDFEKQFFPTGYHNNLEEEIRRRTQGDQEPVKQYVVAVLTLMRRRGGYLEKDKLERIFNNLHPKYKMYVRRRDCTTIGQLVSLAEEFEANVRESKQFNPPPNPAQSLIPETAYQRKRDAGSAYQATVVSRPQPRPTMNQNPVENRNPTTPPIKQREYRPSYRREEPRQPLRQTWERPFPPSRIQNAPRDVNATAHDPMCWNCDRKGHMYRNCPEPKRLRCFYCKRPDVKTHDCACRMENDKRTSENGNRESQTENHRFVAPTSPHVSQINGLHQSACDFINYSIDSRPYIEVRIGDKSFAALLDTGSVVNLISADVAEHLRKHIVKPWTEELHLKLADGSVVKLENRYSFECEIGGKKIIMDATKLPSLMTPIVLGIDIIKGLKLMTFNAPWKPCMQMNSADCGFISCYNVDSLTRELSTREISMPSSGELRKSVAATIRRGYVGEFEGMPLSDVSPAFRDPEQGGFSFEAIEESLREILAETEPDKEQIPEVAMVTRPTLSELAEVNLTEEDFVLVPEQCAPRPKDMEDVLSLSPGERDLGSTDEDVVEPPPHPMSPAPSVLGEDTAGSPEKKPCVRAAQDPLRPRLGTQLKRRRIWVKLPDGSRKRVNVKKLGLPVTVTGHGQPGGRAPKKYYK